MKTNYCFIRLARIQNAFTRLDLAVVIGVISFLALLQLGAMATSASQGHRIVCANNLRQLTLGWAMYAEENNGKLIPNTDGGSIQTGATASWVTGWLNFSTSADNTNINYLINPRYALMAKYVRDPLIYKCPTDTSRINIYGDFYPRVRSYSLNSWIGKNYTRSDDGGWIGGGILWKMRLTMTDLTSPSPAQTFTFIDEREDSINDSVLLVDMTGFPRGSNNWHMVDFPGDSHDNGANLAFADGHLEHWQWGDPRTMPPHNAGQLIPLNVPSPGNLDVLRIQSAATGPINY